jgi:hypothetical protein
VQREKTRGRRRGSQRAASSGGRPIGGLSRVAEAILSLPFEERVDAINAVAESYHKTAQAFLNEEEIERWLLDVLLRLRAEIAKRFRSSG